ncbi:MAG: MarR family transcriptional regulator [Candidatus Methanomethylophilaceae archaeon]|nr:MarR family transcriptional regulator [Candidatus Methanomethylophilaceae archaeon]
MKNENERCISPRVLKAYLEKVTGPSFEELGITSSSAPFLVEINSNEGISLKGLTEHLMVDKAHTTRVVSKLIDAGLVENKANGHEYSLYLTEEGRKKAKDANIIFGEAWKGMLRDLTDEEKGTLETILKKISKVVKEEVQ